MPASPSPLNWAHRRPVEKKPSSPACVSGACSRPAYPMTCCRPVPAQSPSATGRPTSSTLPKASIGGTTEFTGNGLSITTRPILPPTKHTFSNLTHLTRENRYETFHATSSVDQLPAVQSESRRSGAPQDRRNGRCPAPAHLFTKPQARLAHIQYLRGGGQGPRRHPHQGNGCAYLQASARGRRCRSKGAQLVAHDCPGVRQAQAKQGQRRARRA